MARPFVIIGTVMFFSLYLLTLFAVEALPFVIILSAVFSVLLLIIGVRLKGLRPIFLIFLAITLACSSYTFQMKHSYIPAAELTTHSEVTISGKVIDTYNKYDTSYVTLGNLQINNNEKTHHRIQLSGDVLASAEIDDILVITAEKLTVISEPSHFIFPDSNKVYLSTETDAVLAHIKAEKHSIMHHLASLRSHFARTLSSNLDEKYAGAVNAMLTGDKTYLTAETQRIFSYSGISHLFAVSGFHLSMWTGMIFMFTEKLRGRLRLCGNIFALGFVLFFMALTGFTPSVVRSGIMMTVLILGRFIKRNSDSLNSLFFALTLILTVSPFSASSISLQMSFLATLGIVSFTGPLAEPFMRLKKIIRPKILFNILNTLYTTSAMSFIATIFTSPVCAVNFGFYSFIAPLTNILCLPVSQMILPLSSMGILTAFSPDVCNVPFSICDGIMKYILFVAEKLSAFPYATVNTRTDVAKIIIFCLLTVSVFLVCIFHDRAKPLRRTAFSLIICFVLISVSVFNAENHSATVFVPDVGNGTAVVCNIKGNKVIIGCGGDKYREHIFDYTVNSVSFNNFDLLLVPRNTPTESQYFSNLIKTKDFGTVIATDSNFSPETEILMPDLTVRTSFANINIDEKTNLVYIDNEYFHGARLETDIFSCTFIFNPVSDLSYAPDSWQSGNLLITRQNIPHGNTDFDHTIVSSDSARVYDEDNIFSTHASSNITYILTPFSGAKIYADKR